MNDLIESALKTATETADVAQELLDLWYKSERSKLRVEFGLVRVLKDSAQPVPPRYVVAIKDLDRRYAAFKKRLRIQM